MSRTFRNKPDDIDGWADYLDNQGKKRKANKLRKGVDGSYSTSICGRAVEGVLDTFDDVPRSYGKHLDMTGILPETMEG